MNPRFPGWRLWVAILVAGGAVTSPALASPCEGVNSLSPAEKAAGWELQFDGTNTKGWHGYNGQGTKSWTIEAWGPCTIRGSESRPSASAS